MMTDALARVAGVREAPRHEIAVGDVAGVPRALWDLAAGSCMRGSDRSGCRDLLAAKRVESMGENGRTVQFASSAAMR